MGTVTEQYRQSGPENKLLVAGYPKSGNTWFCQLLSYYFSARFLDLQNFERNKFDGKLKREENNSQLISVDSPVKFVLKTHELPGRVDMNQFSKILYIHRDPRDIIVSLYYFKYYFQPAEEGKSVNYNLVRKKLNMMSTIRFVLSEQKRHIDQWRNCADVIVTYENLNLQQEDTMKEIIQSLDAPLHQPTIHEAIEFLSFKNVSGRKKGKENKRSFFRKGIVGDYKNQFDLMDRLLYRLYR